nr:unnamed protein product [Callosobruchus analis]
MRNYKNINHDKFCSDLHDKKLENIYYFKDIDEKLKYVNNAILSVLDIHAPYKHFNKPPAPWLTDDLRMILNVRDAAKNKYSVLKSHDSYKSYKEARNYATQAFLRIICDVVMAEMDQNPGTSKRVRFGNPDFESNLTTGAKRWEMDMKTLATKKIAKKKNMPYLSTKN